MYILIKVKKELNSNNMTVLQPEPYSTFEQAKGAMLNTPCMNDMVYPIPFDDTEAYCFQTNNIMLYMSIKKIKER